jgi:hypothetical protein
MKKKKMADMSKESLTLSDFVPPPPVPDINSMKVGTAFNKRPHKFKYLKMTRNIATGQLKPIMKSLWEMPPEKIRLCKESKREIWWRVWWEKSLVE